MTIAGEADGLAAALAQAAPATARTEIAAILRRHHDTVRDRIAARLAAGLSGLEAAGQYAAAADALMTALWRFTTETLYPAANPTEGERLSLIAVGGYGRGLLAPHSDLDLMFLRPWKMTARTESVTEFMLHVLWDLGLKIGAASRSVEEALALADTDMTVRTALLEARPLAGDLPLSDSFLTGFRDRLTRQDPAPFIAAKLEEREVRHRKAGTSRYRVEPNVKEGKGGLRDLNTLAWLARGIAPEGNGGLDELLTPRERRTFDQASDFLWRVRCHLHLVAGRAEEKLTFDLQPEVARRMGWRGRGDEPAVERFMRRYFLVARDVGSLTRAVSAALEARRHKRTLSLSRLFRPRRRRLSDPAFVEDGGRLAIRDPSALAADPIRLLTLFVQADRHDLDLHPQALAAVSRSLSLVTPALRRDARAAAALLDLLAGAQPYRILTLMNESGLLGRFLPEWGRIVGQTQFNMYHAYTVDEHTLWAIGIINDIARGHLAEDHPLASDVIHRIADREVLMLAMLLHDVGKGGDRGQLEDGAVAARRACERMGLEPRRTELVVWLVRHHLILSDHAQKRDVSDPATVRAFAEQVGDPERLRLLTVLTVADIRAVGPGVWNGWKGQLIRTLYRQVSRLFGGDEIDRETPVADHPELVTRARAEGVAVTAQVRAAGALSQTTEVAVAARDRSGLFADLAATLAAHGADVTDARVATAEGLILDVFQIQDGAGAPFGLDDPARLDRLVAALQAAARPGSACPPPTPRPNPARRAVFDVRPVVMIDTSASEAATVVEVSASDRPGLLAELARTFTDHDLSIRSAHVAVFGERAVDSFYLVDRHGLKPTDSVRLEALRSALEQVLERQLPTAAGRRPTPVRASARDVSTLEAPAPVSTRSEPR